MLWTGQCLCNALLITAANCPWPGYAIKHKTMLMMSGAELDKYFNESDKVTHGTARVT